MRNRGDVVVTTFRYRIGSVVFIDTLSFMQFKVKHFFNSVFLSV